MSRLPQPDFCAGLRAAVSFMIADMAKHIEAERLLAWHG